MTRLKSECKTAWMRERKRLLPGTNGSLGARFRYSGLSVLRSSSWWLGPGGGDGPQGVPKVSERPYPQEARPLLGKLPGPREFCGDAFWLGQSLSHSGSVCFLALSPDFRKLLSVLVRQPG